jgi:hypothetical protein
LTTGAFRFHSHAERQWIADDHRHGRPPEKPSPAGMRSEAQQISV